MSANSPYRVTCSCGNIIPLEKSAAGSQIACCCGKIVEVPRLSELRRAAGERAAVASTADRIRQLIHDDELQLGAACVLDLRPTKDVVFVRIECEMPYLKGGSTWWGLALTALLTLLCSGLFLVLYLLNRSPPQWLGREVVLRVPLQVCEHCRVEFRRLRDSRIKQLLATVPIYEQLLAEYPRAKVFAD